MSEDTVLHSNASAMDLWGRLDIMDVWFHPLVAVLPVLFDD